MLYADTRLEWMVSCQALFRLGATVGTLYTNLGEEGIVHAINETEATHLITNVELLNKIIKLMDKLPNISVIVCITDSHQRQSDLNQKLSDSDRQRVTIYSLDQIQLMGEPALDSPEDIPAQQSKDSTAVLMYTSGSTGVPKGVLIAHKNLLLTIKAFYQICGILSPETDVYAAFLPLAHILEICLELCFISIGIPVGYASVHMMTDKSPGLQKGCRGDLILLQPTFLAVVPLLLERLFPRSCHSSPTPPRPMGQWRVEQALLPPPNLSMFTSRPIPHLYLSPITLSVTQWSTTASQLINCLF